MKNKRLTIGPFINWKVKRLPSCVRTGGRVSGCPLSKKQRDFVLKLLGYETYNVYLQSELWKGIRAKVLKNASCSCGCGRRANQVHHKSYTEANLTGNTQRGLVPINASCHYLIEFQEDRKCNLAEANTELKQRQFMHVAHLQPPTAEEIAMFNRLSPTRKLVVKRYHLMQKHEQSSQNYCLS